MPKSENFSFRPADLPNPYWLTSPENMFFMQLRKEGLSPVEAFVRASMRKREVETKKKRKRTDSTDAPTSASEATTNEEPPLKKKKQTKNNAASSSDEGDSDVPTTEPISKSTSVAPEESSELKEKPAGEEKEDATDDSLQHPPKNEHKPLSSGFPTPIPPTPDPEYELSENDTVRAEPMMKHTTLVGESDGTVEIYETCDEVREKINAHLQGPGAPTKAAFLRSIAQAAYPDGSVKLQSKQLKDFLNQEGARTGSTSRVFYCAYVYFEKLRLVTYLMDKALEGIEPKDVDQDDAPKTEHRQEMEEEWEMEGGMPRERPHVYVVGVGTAVYTDDLGRITTGPEV